MKREGFLAHMGYHVGAGGAPVRERHRILDQGYSHRVPEQVENAASWGAPSSFHRVQKMLRTLDRLAENFRRNDPERYADAIADYEEDRNYLLAKHLPPGKPFPW